MNSNDIEKLLTETDNLIISQSKNLDLVEKERHNAKVNLKKYKTETENNIDIMELRIMELDESVRQGKLLLQKYRLEKGILERQKWVVLKQERGY